MVDLTFASDATQGSFLAQTLGLDLSHYAAANRTHLGLPGFLHGLLHRVVHSGGLGAQTFLVAIHNCELSYPLLFSPLERWFDNFAVRPSHVHGLCQPSGRCLRVPLMTSWERHLRMMLADGYCPRDTMFLLYVGDSPICNGVLGPDLTYPRVTRAYSEGWSNSNPACGTPVLHTQRRSSHARPTACGSVLRGARGDVAIPPYSVYTYTGGVRGSDPGAWTKQAPIADLPHAPGTLRPDPETPSDVPWHRRPARGFSRDTDFCSFLRCSDNRLPAPFAEMPAMHALLEARFPTMSHVHCHRRTLAVLGELYPDDLDACLRGRAPRLLAAALTPTSRRAAKLGLLRKRFTADLRDRLMQDFAALNASGSAPLGALHLLDILRANASEPTTQSTAMLSPHDLTVGSPGPEPHARLRTPSAGSFDAVNLDAEYCRGVPLARFADNRYVIVTEGWASTWKLQHLAHFDSVNVVLAACTELWFQAAYQPWTHFVPANTATLIDTLRSLRTNSTDDGRQIGRNGAAFARTHLTWAAKWSYMRTALNTISELIYEPAGRRGGDDLASERLAAGGVRAQNAAANMHSIHSPTPGSTASVFTPLFEVLARFNESAECASAALVWMIANYGVWESVAQRNCSELELQGATRSATIDLFSEALERQGASEKHVRKVRKRLAYGLARVKRSWSRKEPPASASPDDA